MSGFSLNDTKIAIDNILTGDATLLALLGDGINGIVDNTEQQGGLAYPYIVYSSSTAKPWDTKTSNGTEATLQAKYKKVRGIKWETSKQVRIFYYTRGLQGQAL